MIYENKCVLSLTILYITSQTQNKGHVIIAGGRSALHTLHKRERGERAHKNKKTLTIDPTMKQQEELSHSTVHLLPVEI